MGFLIQDRSGISQHFLFGFFTTFLVTLAQSMTMFYFIGTGKMVKDSVANLSGGTGIHSANKALQGEGLPAIVMGHALHDGDDDSWRRRGYTRHSDIRPYDPGHDCRSTTTLLRSGERSTA